MISLPVPVSPRTSTGMSRRARRSVLSMSRAISGARAITARPVARSARLCASLERNAETSAARSTVRSSSATSKGFVR